MAQRLSFTSPTSAAALLVADGVVALPTETVYGLGALATSEVATSRVFEVKGRPPENPLIVHIRDNDGLDAWAVDIPAYARTLAAHFWPGPLTLVLTSSGHAASAVSSGLTTIALRAPNHLAFQEVLRELELLGVQSPGIAAPSANRFGRVSPTTAEAVAAELGALLSVEDGIVDGGPCSVGLESTIAICGPDGVTVARPGAISADDLAAVAPMVTPESSASVSNLPGSHASHYSPECRVHLVYSADELARILFDGDGQLSAVGVIGLNSSIESVPPGVVRLTNADNAATFAQQLYAALRRADQEELQDVFAVIPQGDGISIAIRDRLQRAADT